MQNEKDLYVIRDYDNNYIYVVKANSREMAMDLVNAYTGLNADSSRFAVTNSIEPA